MTTAYPISAPAEFLNTNAGTDYIFFNASDGLASTENKIRDFVTSTAGDLIVRPVGADNDLDRLAIGTAGQILTVVGGMPTWANAMVTISATTTFTASATTSGTLTLPSSSTWSTVSSSLVLWDTSTGGNNDDGLMFDTTTGIWTVPVTGTYSFSACATFAGNNTGTGTGFGGRRAVREARIYNLTSNITMIGNSKNANSFNGNPNVIELATVRKELTAGDTLALQVRHDADQALALESSADDQFIMFSANRLF
jgi:hypothetical protein